ncbi:MAG: SCO family protein [Pseudomonadota bacterium]
MEESGEEMRCCRPGRFGLPQWPVIVLMVLFCAAELFQVEPAEAHKNHDHSQSAEKLVGNFLKKMDRQICKIPETRLLSVEGERVRLYSDLVKAKTVAISFIYTQCTNICSPISANVGALRDLMRERVGKDVQLVSITIDPVTDTPRRLKKWSRHFDPDEGWVFLTGKKHRIDRFLKQLKVFTPDIEDHPPIMIISNDRTGRCVYTNGLAAPGQLKRTIEELADEAPKAEGSGS